MSAGKLSWKMLTLQFTITFVTVFVTLIFLNFSGFESYGPLVAGIVAGVTVLVLNVIFMRRDQD